MSGEWGELMVWFIRLTLEVFGDLMTGVTGDLLMVMLGLCEFGVRPGVSEEDIRETAGASLLEQMRGKTFQQKSTLTAQRMRRWRNIFESDRM